MERVDPPVGYVGSETVIQVVGENFLPAVDIDATGPQSEFENDFAVELFLPEGEGGPLSVALPGTVLRSYENIEAVVPAGLTPATYDVVVTGPSGASGRLVNGFTASATQADHLAIEGDLLVYQVRSEAQFRIELQDRDGNRVFADEEVVVYVEAADGEASPSFTTGSLIDQIPVGNLAVQGSLGPDGAATFGLTSLTPDQLTVVVTPASTGSPLADGQTVVLFEPGGQIAARLDLPEEDFIAVAGEPFPLEIVLIDQFGNEAPEATTSIVLRSTCSSWVEVVDVIGRATVSPTVTQATSPESSCEAERIVSVTGAAGQTSTFAVAPGAPSRFDVVATPDTVTAGEIPLQVVATPVDAFGNRAQWSGVPAVVDSVNGIGSFDCLVDELIVCDASPLVAGSDIRVTVDGQDGVVGTSDPYDVVPGAPTAMAVAVSTDPIVADDPAVVWLTLLDAFQNTVNGAAFSPGQFALYVDGASIACTALVSPDERVVFGCPVREASAGVELHAELTNLGLSGSAPPVPVVNGALAAASIAVDRTVLAAGENLTATIQATDAWGNPYVTQTDPVVSLTDALGAFPATSVTLDALGEASIQLLPTLAGTTVVSVLQSGSVLGESVPVVVEPGPAELLNLVLSEPWYWVDEPVTVGVQATDAFGNPQDIDGVVTLSSASGSAADSSLALVNGIGEGTLTWSAPQFEERVDASMLTLSGSTGELLIVEDCTAGPRAVLDIPTRTCGVDQSGTVAGDLSNSTSGGSPLLLTALASEFGHTVGPPGVLDVPLEGWGPHGVFGLAVGSDGCAEAVSATTWLGPDDGSVVGPITVIGPSTPVEVGAGSAVLRVEDAQSCQGIPAVGAAVRLRSSRGEISDAAPLGDGLHVAVDGEGTAQASLVSATIVEGPSLTVTASATSGAARGAEVFPVWGDLQLPTVISASPSGQTLGLVDTAVITFSEPLDPATVSATAFVVSGPSPARILFATLLADQRSVELAFQSAVDASAGEWSITVDPSVSDRVGNPLDGGDTGSAGTFTQIFGPDAPDASPVTCSVDTETFRPDGDDGIGEQTDSVTLTPTSANAPQRWVLSVYDDAANLVLRRRVDGSTTTVGWDGRDQSGEVVSDGMWTVEVNAQDARGNLGGPCSVAVDVRNEDLP